MTDEKMQILKDDIAFMRALAQEGSTTPLLFGRVMVAAGLVFGAGAVGHWLIVSGVLRVPSPWFLTLNWLATGLVFAAIFIRVMRHARKQPGFGAGLNKAVGAAWTGVGFAIFTMWLGMTAIGAVTGDWQVMNMFPVLIFALYGAAWYVAGQLGGKGWIKVLAFASFAAAVAMGALTGNPYQMLGYAACLVLLATVPGWILMRQEPTDIV